MKIRSGNKEKTAKMDVVGSEIGLKMRSAIKAKLTELGCYVDDELPDYVMVMVANKRTQLQMEEDLQLFLGDDTELFVNWLHQVLKKLQEVTVAVPLKNDKDTTKERSVSKERKAKDKKNKEKAKKNDIMKKSKKKDKEKQINKKEEKKLHKSKKEKKSKSHERIRPNIPPLLMNMEKESEPSITDVFAGQILKNHGVSLEIYKEDTQIVEKKPIVREKRLTLPIIDPATIVPEQDMSTDSNSKHSDANTSDVPRVSQLKEINEIEAKIQGLKQKLVEQLDSMSDDEDFLNIRTEAEELMNDFADDVFQEISQPTTSTPPIGQQDLAPDTPQIQKDTSKFTQKIPIIQPAQTPEPQIEASENINRETPIVNMIHLKNPKEPLETLPQIELNLPKRPIRDRLGARDIIKRADVKESEKQRSLSPESFTPERELEPPSQAKAAKSRLGSNHSQSERKVSVSDESTEKKDLNSKKLTSKVSMSDQRTNLTSCASVVRVRPRPRASAPASNLLLRAVADAHKSLLNIPPKIDPEPSKVKRALVLPMRRCVDPKKIVIHVVANRQTDNEYTEDKETDSNISQRPASNTKPKEEYTPQPLTKRITNTDYVPSRTAIKKDDSLIIETINIHNPTVDKEKDTQFIVTMDGYHPNAFLAKKLKTEGLLDDVVEPEKLIEPKIMKEKDSTKSKDKKNTCNKMNVGLLEKDTDVEMTPINETVKEIVAPSLEVVNGSTSVEKDKIKNDKALKPKEDREKDIKKGSTSVIGQKKRLSDTSEDSDTQVIIKKEEEKVEKRKSSDVSVKQAVTPPVKKRKASPIVFDVDKKEKSRDTVRERTTSGTSDSQVTLSTTTNSHKYDSVPSLSQAVASTQDKKTWCRAFPACRYGGACAFTHPRCKFAAACTRRGCVYSHPPNTHFPPVVASHVVPAANYKSISSTIPSMCKFYPNCVNPACHFHHPKPCRFGKACMNKLECNFYHADGTVMKFPF